MIRIKTDLPRHSISRNRVLLAIFMLAVMVLGLASRKYPLLLPQVLGKYPGDALWSLLVYLLWAFLKPTIPSYRIAFYAFLTSCLDEFSQIIQTPGLNAIRHTVLGHLILGTVFSWNDIFAYSIGIIIALSLDSIIFSGAQPIFRSK